MNRFTKLISLAWLTSCAVSAPIPDSAVLDVAKEVTKLGHPMGTFQSASVVGMNSGGWLSNSAGRSLDVSVNYTARRTEHTMVVRFHVDQLSPCEVRTEVLSDDGPTPILLDNAISSSVMGQRVCDMLTEE